LAAANVENEKKLQKSEEDKESLKSELISTRVKIPFSTLSLSGTCAHVLVPNVGDVYVE